MANGGEPSSFWDRIQEAPLWVKIVVPIVLVFMIAVAVTPAPEDESDGGGDDSAQQAEEQPAEEPAEEDAPEPAPNPQDEVRDALDGATGPVEDPEIKDVTFGKTELEVTAETPEGGIEGASAEDMDRLTAAILDAIYGDAEWTKTGTVVVFQGGLVDTKSGQELPDANTAIYTIKLGEANRIDWSDQDTIDYVIDWSLYRDFLHPAFE